MAEMADFDLKKDDKGEWYWTFQADNNKTIAKSSESYKNRGDCLHSIKLVKDLSPGCTVWDMTTKPISIVDKLP
jgi:uncharacterized protein YegP (UPF0339 family)